MATVLFILVIYFQLIPIAKAETELSFVIPDSVMTQFELLQGQDRADEILNTARNILGRDPNLCRLYLLEAIKYSESIGYQEGLARAYNGMGSVLCMTGDSIPGLTYFQKALSKYELVDDKPGQAKVLQNISSIQATLGLHQEALATSISALVLREKLGDQAEIAQSLSSLAINYRDIGDMEKALTTGKRSINLKRQLDNPMGLAISLSTVGTIQAAMGRHQEAMDSHREAIALTRQQDDLYYLSVALCNLGATYLDTEQWDLATEVSTEGLKLSKQIGVFVIMENAHTMLAKAYEEKGQSELALKHFHQSKKLKDQVYTEEMSQRISTLTSQFEFARNRNRVLELERDQITARLELQSEQSKRSLYLVGFSISLPLAILAFVLFRKSASANLALVMKASELAEAMENMKTLQGLIPICASCKSVRDDQGYWHEVESYVMKHSEAEFSHGICPDCQKIHYPEFVD